MNSCVLTAQIVQAPQLRYTPDDTPVAEMIVEFPGLRSEDPPATLKVVGWGNLATEISEQYHQGDRILVEGRLILNTIDRPEGFREKRAELNVSKIYHLDQDASSNTRPLVANTATSANSNVVSMGSRKTQSAKSTTNYPVSPTETFSSPTIASPNSPSAPRMSPPQDQVGGDEDDIPF